MKNLTGVKRLFLRLRNYKGNISVIMVLLMVSGLLSVLPAQIIGLSIDLVSGHSVEEGYKRFIYDNISSDAYMLILIFVLVSVLYYITDVIYGFGITKLSWRVHSDLQKDVLDNVIRKYTSVNNEFSIGDIISRTTKEAESARTAVSVPFNGLLRNFVGMLWILVVFIMWNYKLALLAILFSLPLYFIVRMISEKSRKCNEETNRINASLTQEAMNILKNIRFIQVNKSQADESGIAARFVDDIHNKFIKLNKALSRLFPMSNILQTIAVACVLLLTYGLINRNELSAGDAVIVFLYISRFFTPIRVLGYQMQTLSRAEASLGRVFELMDMESEYPDTAYGDELPEAPDMKIENISCSLGGNKIINNLSADIRKNSINILMGDSGAGKSTLINLLLGLVKPSEGDISVSGEKLLNIIHNPANVSVSFQEHNLFNRNLKDNLAYQQDFDENRMNILLESFSLDNFIKKYGYGHILDDNATNISGGERKRMSVVRALYKESPLYILDEPSAELDKENVSRLINILVPMKEKATIIIATHEKALVDIADNIISI